MREDKDLLRLKTQLVLLYGDIGFHTHHVGCSNLAFATCVTHEVQLNYLKLESVRRRTGTARNFYARYQAPTGLSGCFVQWVRPGCTGRAKVRWQYHSHIDTIHLIRINEIAIRKLRVHQLASQVVTLQTSFHSTIYY